MVTLTYQERFKTIKGVFDEFTNRNLFKLQSQGVFDELASPLKVGKESNVFIAKQRETLVIVKIYHVQNCSFKKMFDYIKQDSRYEFLHQKRREIIFSWTQREYKNLLKAAKAKVKAPKALGWKMNILVEEMIGPPALPIKDAIPENPGQFLGLIIEEMKKLFRGGLVHGDLSAFNILNYNEEPYLIDFSQATLIKTRNAEELLQRDIKNICTFFSKQGIKANAEDIRKEIVTGN